MADKILFVDDEKHILDAMRRQLRKRFEVATAEGGAEGLEILKKTGPFSVVVSDMRMPNMNGIEFLSAVKELYPDTVRMMLTGNADQETAIEAVNKGQIFKFLNKPCPMSVLAPSLALAIHQYRLITAEKELLQKTLKGSIKVLSELLSFANPTAFSSVLRIRPLVMDIGKNMGIHSLWQLEIAVLMSRIGCITLPTEIINKIYTNSSLDDEEQEMYSNHPFAGAKLLEAIPRLEDVVHIIRLQLQKFNEYEAEDNSFDELDICAQIIHTAFDYDLLVFQGADHHQAVAMMVKREGRYNPKILKVLKKIEPQKYDSEMVVHLPIKDLTVGMVVDEPIFSKNDTLLAPKGQEITTPVLQGLRNFSRKVGVREPVVVRIYPQGGDELPASTE